MRRNTNFKTSSRNVVTVTCLMYSQHSEHSCGDTAWTVGAQPSSFWCLSREVDGKNMSSASWLCWPCTRFFLGVSLEAFCAALCKDLLLSLNLAFSNTEPYNCSGAQHDATSLKHASLSLMLCQFFLNAGVSACAYACVCV